jgi:hypothetical protein
VVFGDLLALILSSLLQFAAHRPVSKSTELNLADVADVNLRSACEVLPGLAKIDMARSAARRWDDPCSPGKCSRPPCGIGRQGGYFPQPFHNGMQTRRVFQLTYPMTDDDERELQTELARLQQEHRDLDAAIDALHHSPAPDLLRLQRLKKRKLQLRDRISFIEDQITPDIIA